MKSKFKYGAYILAVLVILFTGIMCSVIALFIIFDIPVGFFLIILACFAFCFTWLVFGELRTKVIQVEIGYDNFTAKGYFGLGPQKTYYFRDIDGYIISILPASGTAYEYLYIVARGKKVIKLSQFYHKNYDELKSAVNAAHIKNLGFEDFSYAKELKEIFI